MARRWLLVLTQIPARPDYLRVKIGRRLARVGAVPIKAGVYALPATDETREDFAWILREVVDGGGEAQIVEATLVDGLDDDALVARFTAARDAEAAPVVEALRVLAPTDVAELARLRKRVDEIGAVDFFGSAAVAEARALLRLREAVRAVGTGGAELRGRVWVTRAGVKVDRMATAWLVRRFVDPDATFRFVAARSAPAEAGVVRFDMMDGDLGHEGDACTFEVLLGRLGLDDPGLRVIAELVHDVDCKDGKFGRPEAAGFAQTVEAIAAAHRSDERRLERAFAWLDDLLALTRRSGA